ncbi:hypothetical protein [Agathobacter sp.]|uniref:hypothetical protein n=1 Tax=Agathobacter sp. TaxID=2021311 RepID=UPI002A908D0C|nr:hypothetical protein [Agathobacter sp.]MDY5862660.1 hypothetical protein [Agathobacter sp.]
MDNENKATSTKKKNVVIIILVIIILALIAGGIAFYIISNKEKPKDSGNGYDTNIILSKDDISTEKTESGHMTLEMKNSATSEDGENFTCYLCNANENTFDMYMTIATEDGKEEIFKSGVLPVGSRIETFKTSKKLEPGTYNAVITFHQLESDGTTEHSKVSVAYTLSVGE